MINQTFFDLSYMQCNVIKQIDEKLNIFNINTKDRSLLRGLVGLLEVELTRNEN